MKDQLINLGKPFKNECGIFNLNNSDEMGSHWVAWKIDNNMKIYFDSYGDSMPPKELVSYLGNDLYYNTSRYQDYSDPPICGYLCLEFIKNYKKFT